MFLKSNFGAKASKLGFFFFTLFNKTFQKNRGVSIRKYTTLKKRKKV